MSAITLAMSVVWLQFVGVNKYALQYSFVLLVSEKSATD